MQKLGTKLSQNQTKLMFKKLNLKTDSELHLSGIYTEETTQLLIPLFKVPHVQAACEYSQQSEGAEWIFRYAGAQMDLTQSDDELGLTVLRGMSERMDYSWNETEPLPNSLHIKIRSEERNA